MTVLFRQYIFFLPLNQFACNGLSKGRRIFTRVPSMNPMHPENCGIRVESCARSGTVGHRISFAAAVFTQLAMKSASSFAEVLDQFHWADSNVQVLSCFKYITKLSNRCSGLSFGGRPELAPGRHVDRAVVAMIEHTSLQKSSKSAAIKLVTVWKRYGVVWTVAR
jgi:hypothetical protein